MRSGRSERIAGAGFTPASVRLPSLRLFDLGRHWVLSVPKPLLGYLLCPALIGPDPRAAPVPGTALFPACSAVAGDPNQSDDSSGLRRRRNTRVTATPTTAAAAIKLINIALSSIQDMPTPLSSRKIPNRAILQSR